MNATLQKPPELKEQAKGRREEIPPLNALPSAEDYAAAARRRTWSFLIGGMILAALVAGSFVVLGLDNILVPLTLLIAVLTPILFWRFPSLILYVTLAAACLFEMFQMSFADSLTDRVPFFWNVNTIIAVYTHVNVKAVPLNLIEVFLLTAGICSVFRSVFTGTARLRGGVLLLPILIYLGFVTVGWVHGLVTGGDFKISLQEVRSQFYFLLTYLMAVNLIQERRQVGVVLWVSALCIGLKGVLYTFRRYVTLSGMPITDQGVGSHEEAFFFDCFLVLLIVLAFCGAYKRLQWVMLSLLPFVVLGNIACNRRAGTAALAIVLPLLFLAAHRALPGRRRLIAILAATFGVCVSIYYPLFQNSNSAFAQPARAIRSQFHPDARDAGSNASRDAENANLMETIHRSPLLGNGYGQRYLHIHFMWDISSLYGLEDYIPHNTILWIWERLGSVGFLAFWMMVSAIIILAGQTLRLPDADAQTKLIGLFAFCLIIMLMIFGLLDLQMSNYRDVLFAGVWFGILAAAPALAAPALAGRGSGHLGGKDRP